MSNDGRKPVDVYYESGGGWEWKKWSSDCWRGEPTGFRNGAIVNVMVLDTGVTVFTAEMSMRCTRCGQSETFRTGPHESLRAAQKAIQKEFDERLGKLLEIGVQP